jgi:hypothetical protein
MTSRFTILATLGLMAAFIATPAHTRGVQAQAPDSHDHAATAPAQGASAEQSKAMMATMMAADARLGELVNKMNDLPGTAKTDAISEVVTALVEQHRAMHTMMMDMGMMSGAVAHGQDTPKK